LAWLRRKPAQVGCSLWTGGDSMSFEDLPDGGSGDLDVERGQFAVDAPIAPRGMLTCQTQDQGTDRPDSARAPSPPRSTGSSVTMLQKVAVPAQNSVRTDQQLKSPKLIHADDEAVRRARTGPSA
jgi:hypothetical protein